MKERNKKIFEIESYIKISENALEKTTSDEVKRQHESYLEIFNETIESIKKSIQNWI